MASIDELLEAGLVAVGDKPTDDSPPHVKKAYSEKVSAAVAAAMAEDLRSRGLQGARPAQPGQLDPSGAERRIAGGIGAKKVDVTWATEESGLLLGISIKGINFRDRRSMNYQKNLTNRRGDMLFEAVTLHRRFPYAVLGGVLLLDNEAKQDHTARRHSTFVNAHDRLQLFTGREDPGGRDEQYERLYVVLLDASSKHARLEPYLVGIPEQAVTMAQVLDELASLVAIRNPDFYQNKGGRIVSVSR